jgi:hypothetical protein
MAAAEEADIELGLVNGSTGAINGQDPARLGENAETG